MPGPFTHIYTARRVADFLASASGTFTRPTDDPLQPAQTLDPNLLAQLNPAICAKAMNDWPKFVAVGAIGPDLFFFLQDYNIKGLPCDEIMLAMSFLYFLDDQGRLDNPYDGLLAILSEVNGTWANILRFIIKLDQIWQKFLAVWNQTIGAILSAAGQVVDDLTGGLLTALGDAFTELKNDLMNLAEEELLTEGDIFGWFALKMRVGYDEKAFLWSDMTHYRRTSIVPARLIAHARTMLQSGDAQAREHGEQLLAYALGWVCHVGTDVIEHSFVNEQCGGPFRTHWQRHHLIENHIDGWNYQCTADGTLPADPFIGFMNGYPSIADSALVFAVQIPQGIDQLPHADKQGDLRKVNADGSRLTDTDGALPLWLAEIIVQVFVEIYADPSEGGDAKLQGGLNEGSVPHPLNLLGQPFQDGLHDAATFTGLITKWMSVVGIDNVGMAMSDLLKIIAPDPPASLPKGIPPGFPSPWEVMTAYRFMLSWFKRSYVATLDMDRPEPPTVFTPPSSDYNFGPPDFSGVGSSDDPLSNACSALLALLDWLFKTLGQIAQLLYDTAKSAASAATWPARDALYLGVTLPAWQAAENIRMVLVHLGYLMPQSAQNYPDGNLRRPNEIDQMLVTLGQSVDSAFQQALAAAWDPLGNLDGDPALNNIGVRTLPNSPNPWLPVRVTRGQKPPGILSVFTGNDVVEYQRPWAFPQQTNDPSPKADGNYLETPLTVPGPYVTNTMPHTLLGLGSPTSNIARVLYESAGCPADTDLYNQFFILHERVLAIRGDVRGTNPLGDPVIFASYLIGQIANNPQFLSSFNLDADRGYGYLCWDWVRLKPGTQAIKPDGMGNPFIPPVTWPEGCDPAVPPAPIDPRIEFWARPAPTTVGPNLYSLAMQLQYVGRRCKEGQAAARAAAPGGIG